MKKTILFLFLSCVSLLHAQTNDSIPPKNKQIIDTVLRYGEAISPTYQEAVCTEFVIGVLKHFITLSKEDIVNININQPRKSIEDVYLQMENGSPFPKGVVHALTHNGKGEAITNLNEVKPGDFVQFWYPRSWGHCGIVEHIDLEHKVVYLYSSFPSTDGYGIQPFDMPEYCYFVRLK
ncbi:MAG: hypothetical protein QE487_12195 [Fluviicola sp.]|nr:hypothetical protein [Fluviicola sp.]